MGAIHLLGPDGSIRPAGNDVAASVEDLRWSSDGATIWRWRPMWGRPGRSQLRHPHRRGARRIRGSCDRQTTGVGCGRIDVATGATTQLPLAGLNMWEFDWHGGDVAALVSEDPSESGWYDARVVRIVGDEVDHRAHPSATGGLDQPRARIRRDRDGRIAGVGSRRAVRRITVVTGSGDIQTISVGFDAAEVRLG